MQSVLRCIIYERLRYSLFIDLSTSSCFLVYLYLQLLGYLENQYSSIRAACLHEPIDVGVWIWLSYGLRLDAYIHRLFQTGIHPRNRRSHQNQVHANPRHAAYVLRISF